MKRFVLIPYNRYQRLLSTNESSNVAEKAKTSVSDDEQTIIKSSEEEQNSTKESQVTKTKAENSSLESLLPHFSKSIRNRVKSLLTYIQPHVSWNSKGEVISKGSVIPSSNIVDLIKVHMKDYKDFRPVGKDAFGEILLELNVPTSLLAASVRQQMGKGAIPPPPGIPVKRKLPQTSMPGRIKWLRL